MKIILNENEKSIEKDSIHSADDVINHINTILQEKLIFSHVVIHGQEIYTDIEDYIDNYLHEIKIIQVVAKTKREFINDTLLTAEEYLLNAKSELNNLIDHFYKNPSPDDWKQFKHFTDGLKWITDMIINIDSLKERPSNWMEYVVIYQQLEGQVQELAEAVENQDETLLADILNYEIKPLYESLKQLITNTIDIEGSRPDVN